MSSDSRCKNACKMLADLCPCFHQSPTRPNFGRSPVKVCPILCRLRTKLCPNFGCSRARLCPISFAPCPFPNLAGTLMDNYVIPGSLKVDGYLARDWLAMRWLPGAQVKEFCPNGTRTECMRVHAASRHCDKLHFRKIIHKHTDGTISRTTSRPGVVS